MSNILQQLKNRGLITYPSWIGSNTHYLTIMGSHAYGCADTSVKDKIPDYDVCGFAIPPKGMIFPHLDGIIPGFGPKQPEMKPWQKPNVFDADALGGKGKEWDFNIYGIVQFFQLCLENNPNMMDTLFTGENQVIHCTQVGRLVRDNRKLFLSKLCWKKFRGYAMSQLHKIKEKKFDGAEQLERITAFEAEHGLSNKTTLTEIREEIDNRQSLGRPLVPLFQLTDEELFSYERMFEEGNQASKRFEIHKFHGYDVKFAYHIIRLFDEGEQILEGGDLDLQRAKEVMKAIRRGEWTVEQLSDWTIEKDKALEAKYSQCTLPERPPYEPIRLLLLKCLEEHYGSLENCVVEAGWAEQCLKDIDKLVESARQKLYA